jgi:hypothetical protein
MFQPSRFLRAELVLDILAFSSRGFFSKGDEVGTNERS